MNNGGAAWLKRAVAITIGATFVLGAGIMVWGLAFSSAPPTLASEPDPVVIIPIDSTQPGAATSGQNQVAQSPGDATQPTTVPAGSSTPAPTSSAPAATAQPMSTPSSGGSVPTPVPTVAPTPTPAPSTCGSGGTCTLADIQTHNSSADCRAAINIDGTISVYAPSQTFLNSHRDNFRSITNMICGKVYSSNLKQAVNDHHDGSTHLGLVFQQWLNNFYLGPYQ